MGILAIKVDNNESGLMKICIIAPVVIPILNQDQEYGGIETVISIASEEMVRRGHDVYLFASGDSKTSAKLIVTTPKALGQGFSFDKEKRCNRKAYELAIKEQPDIIWDHTLAIHAHKLHADKSEFIYKIDVELKTEKLVDTGNILVVHTLHGPARDYMPKIISALSDEGHFFVSISTDQARRFLPYLDARQHLGTVYNAVDMNMYNVNDNKKGNYLLWAGRYCMEKGPHIALEVSHRVGMPLKLMGKMAEKHEVAYFKKFVEPIMGQYDKVLGVVSLTEKRRLLKNAKAIMMTNLWAEPFGLVAAESMASGTPVVGPALGSLTELIDRAGVLVPVDDLGLNENDTVVTANQRKYIDRIVKYMSRLDEVPQSVPRKRAELLFSPKHNADGYEEAFEKAIYLKKRK